MDLTDLQMILADFGAGLISYDELWDMIERNSISEACGAPGI